MQALYAFSIKMWMSDAWAEMVHYFTKMNTTQWGIVSTAAVIFGFLCLKGTSIRG